GGRVGLYSRKGADWSKRYPRIVAAASRIKGSAIIDAEAVYLDAKGRAQFDLLHSRLNDHVAISTAFDLLMLNDEDMRRKPFILRKAAFRKLLRQNEDIQYFAHIKADAAKMFQAVCKLGLEGIVSKKLNAPYRSGPSKTLRSKLKIRRLPLQRGHWMGRSDVRKGRLGEKRPFHKRTREKVFRFGSCFISLRL